ncbi:BTAD domain-containing putative transcriptional regulator [Streptomyces sp. NBC_01481]|uniref:AfsR/SARP family transcriptional regulator n=1 Tax=Streptomyces sp. NBC_01481 TaxID=2975869 RepID=UPI0022582086|nr:BTAD domain-containing putative transcriptional regulator [Streptomyces sp. NBC_01481]MCX4588135.1 winged helix-turn-helix domain-containing protein [Streptomyces sp. NBC_01481]
MLKPDAPLPRGHLVDDAAGHCATDSEPNDLSGADAGLQLLRVALRLIQDADGGDEGTRMLKQVAGRLDSTGMAWSSQAVRSAWLIAAQRLDAASSTAECGCRDDHAGQALARSGASLTDLSCDGCGRHLTSSARCRRAMDAHLVRSWAWELLALLDVGEEPPVLELSAVRSGHPANATAPLVAPRPDSERRRSPRCAPSPGSTGASPAAVPNGPTGRWHAPAASVHPNERNSRVAIRCFGGFRMTVGDLVVDWTRVRPRARAAMRLLTMRAGRPVHREALIEALWPAAPPKSATANLQVAVSSLRSVLEPDRDRGKPRLVVRVGDAYLLNLPSDAYLDTLEFQTALTRGKQAKATGDTATAVQGLRDALAQYHGELLPEDGPAEWLQQDREIYRRQAADAAAELAAAELQAGNLQEAVAAAEKCLAIDRFHDTGWHLLLRTYHRIGAPAAAEQARRRYAATLASLGLDTDEPGLASPPPRQPPSGGEPRCRAARRPNAPGVLSTSAVESRGF